MRVTSIPSRASSQQVSREPWFNGRVSQANTRTFLPAATADRITPSAVPQHRQASAPALQWVRTVQSSGKRSLPNPPSLRQVNSSSSATAFASATARAFASATVLAIDTFARTRSIPHERLTAVGRVLLRKSPARRRSSRNLPRSPSVLRTAASAMPIAPAMPRAGAPRISSLLIARARSSTVVHRISSYLPGRRV